MQTIFKFLIKDKVIPVQPFDKLMNISKNIRNELIFSSEHLYEIESKVGQEIIEEFIKYIVFGETPEITINNINEYETLSEEFSVMKETINNKKNEYGEYLINFKGVSSEDERMRNIYEERISRELDEYLERYGEEMMKIPIQTLYNIFNHHQRKLNNHNLAYEHIISYFNKTQDSNIFILLDLLDGHKLTRNKVEESYSLYSTRNKHMPKIEFSTISELFSTQRTQSEILEEQQIKYSELLTKMSQQQEQQEIKYKKSIETLENKFEQLLNIQQRKQSEILEEQKIQYSELLTKMSQQQEQQEIKYKKSIETLENKIEQLIKTQQTIKDNIEIKYTTINERLEKQIKNNEQDKENFNNKIHEQMSNIIKIEKKFNDFKKATTNITQSVCQPIIVEPDKRSPGILQQLKNNEKSPFDHLFIASQSSADIYSIIDPNANDSFSINDIGKFIEFELQETISIIGIKLFSASKYFPKSFDIEIDDKKVTNVKEAEELKGENQEMTINISSIKCNKIRIINRGQNWDNKNNFCYFKRIELLSNESEYSRGVFSTLVDQSENHDPHKCPVLISASDFDFNTFHSIDSPTNICTHKNANSWFQIEFPKGKAIISGFRLKRCDASRLKQYKIICTDDVFKSLSEWTTLIEIDEQSKTEHEILDIYEFSQPSPPIKFIRLVQTGPNWKNTSHLKFYHFDLFGRYF